MMRVVEEAERVTEGDEPAPDDQDARLLARVATGDRGALAALYERWRRPLFTYLLTRTQDRATAEEILQDTMVAVWQGAARYEGRARTSTWLFGIARRQAWNRLRGRAANPAEPAEPVAPVEPSELVALPAVEAGPEEVALARERVAQVAAAIGRLSPEHREVLVLAFDGRFSYQEIAGIVDVPVGTVRSRLSNAKRILLALTEEER